MIVASYLIRMEPFAQHFLRLQVRFLSKLCPELLTQVPPLDIYQAMAAVLKLGQTQT